MSCNCHKSKNLLKVDSPRTFTTPYMPCIYCTTKHLAYAQALYAEQDIRYLANLYLAHLHSRLRWPTIADSILDILRKAFSKQDILEDLDEILHRAHNTALTGAIDSNDKIAKVLNFSNEQMAFILLVAAQELYSYEVGYKHINTPYVIGMLERATPFVNPDIQMQIRDIWKTIEEDAPVKDLFENIIKSLYSILL